MTKIIAYIRTSTDKQELNNQKLEILEYAQKNNLKISEFIEIQISSRKTPKQRRIEDVQIGDKIQDGFGDEQIIENKFIYDVAEELFIFELDGRIIEITADHKLYIVRDDLVMLLPASEIKDTDEIIGNLLDKPDTHENNKNNL